KKVLSGTWEPERALLTSHESCQAAGVRLMLGSRARSVDLERREVALDDDRVLAFDRLVVATGSRPRRLGLGVDAHRLRSLADALALRRALVPGMRLVVVGGGLVGCEVAATALELGVAVTLVERNDVPMARQFGRQVRTELLAVHLEHGLE